MVCLSISALNFALQSDLCRCGHCKKLAPHWTQLAGLMRHKLNVAEVNCEAHSALCKQQGVSGYPMLFYYGGQSAGKTEYTGARKIEQLKAFAEKVSGPFVSLLFCLLLVCTHI